MSKERKQFQTLRELALDLEAADAVQALLNEIWAWYGPYGPETDLPREFLLSTNAQKLIRHLQMPDELRHKLQTHFKFDDSE